MDMPSAYLGPLDILVVQVGVGALPPTMAKAHMEHVKEGMRAALGEHQQIIFLGVAQQRETTFAVIHRGP